MTDENKNFEETYKQTILETDIQTTLASDIQTILEADTLLENEQVMKDYIIENFGKIKKKLSPERRKLIFKRLNQNLRERYLFVKSIMEDSFCCNFHKTNKAGFINKENFTPLCDQCIENLPEHITINIENQEELKMLLRKMVTSADVFLLDKLHYKLLNRECDFHLTTMILLGRSIADKIVFNITRCCVCNKKISYGTRSGVLNECKHISCFGCCLYGYDENCNVCKGKLVPVGDDVEIDINEYRIYCHHLSKTGLPHLLYNYTGNVYKLPCLHNVCDEHLSDELCQFCNVKYDSKKLKLNYQLMKIIDVLKIYCLEHNKIAVSYDTFTSKAFCKKCPDKDLGLRDFEIVRKTLINRLRILLIEKKLKKKSVDQQTMKAVINYRRLPLQTLYRLVTNYIHLAHSSKDFDTILFNRFHNFFPQKGSNRVWKITNRECVGFNIIPKKTFLLHGLLVAKPIEWNFSKKLILSIYRNQRVTIKLIKENESEKEIFNQLSCFNETSLNDEENLTENDVFFKLIFYRFVRLKEGRVYKLILRQEGNFFHGKPYKRVESDVFKLEKMNTCEERGEIEFGNNAVGGNIFGVIYSENKLLDLSVK